MRRLLVVAFLAGCHSAPEPAKNTPSTWSEATFDTNVQAVLAKHFDGKSIKKLEPDLYRVGDFEVRTSKARSECREDWAHCDAAVGRTVAAIDQLRHAEPARRDQLRVILRSNDKLSAVKERMKGVITQPFSSDAQWVLAVDMPNVIGYDVDLGALGLSADEAWKLATANTKPGKLVTAKSGGGSIVYQDAYAPSALRYPELLEAAARKEAPDRRGNLLAVTPEENILLFTVGGDLEAGMLRDAATNGIKNSEMPLSTHVMEWTGRSWRERADAQ
ncbi:MAG TPA: hypothetical protein VMZ53_24775 [Kofleriaceae bacterium]|nr:hypothetical protein [Kofleriaceae bacterium]